MSKKKPIVKRTGYPVNAPTPVADPVDDDVPSPRDSLYVEDFEADTDPIPEWAMRYANKLTPAGRIEELVERWCYDENGAKQAGSLAEIQASDDIAAALVAAMSEADYLLAVIQYEVYCYYAYPPFRWEWHDVTKMPLPPLAEGWLNYRIHLTALAFGIGDVPVELPAR